MKRSILSGIAIAVVALAAVTAVGEFGSKPVSSPMPTSGHGPRTSGS